MNPQPTLATVQNGTHYTDQIAEAPATRSGFLKECYRKLANLVSATCSHLWDNQQWKRMNVTPIQTRTFVLWTGDAYRPVCTEHGMRGRMGIYIEQPHKTFESAMAACNTKKMQLQAQLY